MTISAMVGIALFAAVCLACTRHFRWALFIVVMVIIAVRYGPTAPTGADIEYGFYGSR